MLRDQEQNMIFSSEVLGKNGPSIILRITQAGEKCDERRKFEII